MKRFSVIGGIAILLAALGSAQQSHAARAPESILCHLPQRQGEDRQPCARQAGCGPCGRQCGNLGESVRKLRAGMMPPAGLPRPAKPAMSAFLSGLEASLDRAAAAKPNPGAPALHRMNRGEYANSIRDLMAVNIDAANLLPADDSSEGFDNIADVLGVSPALLERYIAAAAKISRLADRRSDTSPTAATYKARGDLSQERSDRGSSRRYSRRNADSPHLPARWRIQLPGIAAEGQLWLSRAGRRRVSRLKSR